MATKKYSVVAWSLGFATLVAVVIVGVAGFQAGVARDNNEYGTWWDMALPWLVGALGLLFVAWIAACVAAWRANPGDVEGSL